METPGVERRIEATPAQVFAVLADGWLYPTWVIRCPRVSGPCCIATPNGRPSNWIATSTAMARHGSSCAGSGRSWARR